MGSTEEQVKLGQVKRRISTLLDATDSVTAKLTDEFLVRLHEDIQFLISRDKQALNDLHKNDPIKKGRLQRLQERAQNAAFEPGKKEKTPDAAPQSSASSPASPDSTASSERVASARATATATAQASNGTPITPAAEKSAAQREAERIAACKAEARRLGIGGYN